SGAVRCWGSYASGVLGYPGQSQNIGDGETAGSGGDVGIGGNVVQLAAGSAHTCALLQSGSVRCWGDGTYGRLGYGTGANHIGDDEHPSAAGDVPLGGRAVQIAAGVSHTCAVLDTGGVRCWGRGQYGR